MAGILNSMKDLMRGIRTLHPFWQLWVMVLMGLNFFCPLIFIDRIEAVCTLIAGMLGAGLGMFLVSRQGFTRLMGLMHIPWIPLVFYLWGRHAGVEPDSLFGIWMTAVIAFNSISLMIDTVDVIRFLRGERSPL
ncbi:MAG: hypothetical protein COV67_14645 [Nitrospinae bacterium CG11_big_fil_rev_8_21_14_0_20_56_8]|nr:MAG: hypothetical protein COV67_14645 [Nitrospinae bacterium CG11_big_fil_rev_8_21_14_0_20_56_8]